MDIKYHNPIFPRNKESRLVLKAKISQTTVAEVTIFQLFVHWNSYHQQMHPLITHIKC